MASFLFSAYYLGRLVLRGAHHPVLTSFVGGLILIAALQVPWLNILVWLAMVFFGLGAELLELQRHRPWATGPRVTGPRAAGPGSAAPSAPAPQPEVRESTGVAGPPS